MTDKLDGALRVVDWSGSEETKKDREDEEEEWGMR